MFTYSNGSAVPAQQQQQQFVQQPQYATGQQAHYVTGQQAQYVTVPQQQNFWAGGQQSVAAGQQQQFVQQPQYVTVPQQQNFWAGGQQSAPQQQFVSGSRTVSAGRSTTSPVREIRIGAGQIGAVEPQVTRTMVSQGASVKHDQLQMPVQYATTTAGTRDIPFGESTKVERVAVQPEVFVNHLGSRGTQRVDMDKQEIMMTEHEIVMPGETVVHPQAVQIEEEEVVMQPETRLAPREVIVQPHTVVQPQEVKVIPQVIIAKPKTVIEPEEVFLTPQTVIQPKGVTLRPQEIIVADEEIVVKTGKTTVHDLGTDVYKQDADIDLGGTRGFQVSYNHNISQAHGNTREVHNLGVSTVRNIQFEGYQNFNASNSGKPSARTINMANIGNLQSSYVQTTQQHGNLINSSTTGGNAVTVNGHASPVGLPLYSTGNYTNVNSVSRPYTLPGQLQQRA